MTTNTNDTTKQQALTAIYRKYLTLIEGMSRDDAVKASVNCPYTAEELNNAIAKKQRLSGFSAKPESNKEKTLDDYLTPEQISEAKRLVSQGIRGNTLKMYCRDLFKVRDKVILQAIVSLLDVKVTRGGTRGDSIHDKFNAFCAEKIRTNDEMREFLTTNGGNSIKRDIDRLIRRGEFFNQVHKMYMK